MRGCSLELGAPFEGGRWEEAILCMQFCMEAFFCWLPCSLALVCELLSLLHKVSVFDRYFDSHREDCRNTYAFVLNTLSWLLNDTPLERECEENCLAENLYIDVASLSICSTVGFMV